MEPQLSHRQIQRLFVDAVDEELPSSTRRDFESHLESCVRCREGWERYSGAVSKLRSLPRERAPRSLATTLALRTRRARSWSPRARHSLHAHYRVPVEIILPLLLAVTVAVFLLLSSS